MRVPRAASAIDLNGELSEASWIDGSARTPPFAAEDGAPARPYSDARLLWGDGFLYLALYAADEDIRAALAEHDAPIWTEDSFHVAFARRNKLFSIEVSPIGTTTDFVQGSDGKLEFGWQSLARVGHDLDGKPNDASDDDEEWVIELAIPLSSLGLRGVRGERVGFSVHRCDTPKSGVRVCASFGEGGRKIAIELQ